MADAFGLVAAARHLDPSERAQLAADSLADHDPVVLVSVLAHLGYTLLTVGADTSGLDADGMLTTLGLLHAREFA